MLFEAEGCENYLSAAILDPETLYQRSDGGLLFPELLTQKGIVPGVKPHLKVYTLPGTNGDTVMQGLDSLADRCKEYYAAGARFAKWRSPLVIDTEKLCPTDLAIKANMHDLARYALICQSEGLMPIVEPDISLSGSHTLEEAIDVNIRVQSELFKAMSTFCVVLFIVIIIFI
jgi:fructose-bisphosphate aldolase class I